VKQIVRTCLQIKSGDIVTINSWHHALNLAEEIALECYRVGAVPQITIMSDSLWYRLMSEIPAENLSKTPLHVLKSLDGETACMSIHGPEEPPDPKRIKLENLEAIRKALKPIADREEELKIKILDVYLGKVTPKRAEAYGLNYREWHNMILESMRTDYTQIKAIGKRVAEVLAKGKNVVITSESGTELKLKIEGRKPFINDGVIDREDVEAGRIQSMLPAGTVEIAPIESSAEGKVVFDTPHYTLGMRVENMRWTFERGKLVKMEASSGLEELKGYLSKISGEWDTVGRLIIGLNPAIRPPCIFDELAKGAISIGIGHNIDIGGQNKASARYSAVLTKATLEVDLKY